jgi:hypothetical protein
MMTQESLMLNNQAQTQFSRVNRWQTKNAILPIDSKLFTAPVGGQAFQVSAFTASGTGRHFVSMGLPWSGLKDVMPI